MWISKKELQRIRAGYEAELGAGQSQYIELLKTNAQDENKLRSEMAKLGSALSAILPESLRPQHNWSGGYDFSAIYRAAESVKRNEVKRGDREILKVVKMLKEQ